MNAIVAEKIARNQTITNKQYIIQNETDWKEKCWENWNENTLWDLNIQKEKKYKIKCTRTMQPHNGYLFFFSTMSIRHAKNTTHVTKGPANSFETFSVICPFLSVAHFFFFLFALIREICVCTFVRASLPFCGILCNAFDAFE